LSFAEYEEANFVADVVLLCYVFPAFSLMCDFSRERRNSPNGDETSLFDGYTTYPAKSPLPMQDMGKKD
jgi:hypothetical protein